MNKKDVKWKDICEVCWLLYTASFIPNENNKKERLMQKANM